MEPETSSRTQAQNAADLRASEVEALRSHVVDIIGGAGRRGGARRSLEDPGEELQEEEEEDDEGDDSVFYDDGVPAPRPGGEEEEEEEEEEEARPRLCDARKRREGLVGSEGGVGGGPGPGGMDAAVASATQMEERPQETQQQDVTKSRLEEQHQEPRQRSLATGDSKDPGGGFTEDKHTPEARPAELCTSIPKGDVADEEVKEEEVEEEEEEEEEEVEEEGEDKKKGEEEVSSRRRQRRAEPAAEPGPGGGKSKERRAPTTTTTTAAAATTTTATATPTTTAAAAAADAIAVPEPAGAENLPPQSPPDELQIPGAANREEEPDLQLEQQDHNSQSSTGPRPQEEPGTPGYSTLPLPRRLSRSVSAKQVASDVEASGSAPRYNTLSYRKIQRGNTRQKIKEFEFKGMEL